MVSDRTLLNQTSLGWLLLIALVVLGAGLGLRDPWPADEPRFALIAKEMVESGQWLFPMRGGELYPDKPPLFMWGIAIGYVLTGSIKVAFLLPSLLAGLLTILLVWDLGRRQGIDLRRLGLQGELDGEQQQQPGHKADRWVP